VTRTHPAAEEHGGSRTSPAIKRPLPRQEALAHGIPLLIAGQGETKVEVAVGHAWTDAALNITETAEAGIHAALGTVTGDPAYRAHARRMQAIPPVPHLACPVTVSPAPGHTRRPDSSQATGRSGAAEPPSPGRPG
jgi:hypothetical protein